MPKSTTPGGGSLPETGLELIEAAWEFAAAAHDDQEYGEGTGLPYSYHLAQVALKLLELGYDACTIAAGILHDVVEDVKGVTFQDLEEAGFPEPVVVGVKGMTYFANGEKNKERRRQDKVAQAKGNPISWVVKYVDSWCNREASHDWPKADDPRGERSFEKYDKNVKELEVDLPLPEQIQEHLGDLAISSLSEDDRSTLSTMFTGKIDDACNRAA
ncbi:HD domain-containing protein [Candidatus Saccharibacteria bacterium]|nr:HD domain-containing protein [Candidatus Saccharibacteria bacterium]